MDLKTFIKILDKQGELLRVDFPLDPHLEITEFSDRVMRKKGPAILIEKPKGFDIPVFINGFGSKRRMELAFSQTIESICEKIEELLSFDVPKGFMNKLKALGKLKDLSSFSPKLVKSGPCQELVFEDPSLDMFPILKCWPKDGGKYITMPVVVTKNPKTGVRNAGMYRMQVFDSKTTGMHWHPTKDGAVHYQIAESLGKDLEVAVCIGPDPAVTYAATSPLPEDVDEFFFAGFLQKEPVELVKCKTVDIEVPANSQIVLEGYIKPFERRKEGPFGDHTGFYSEVFEFPVFHINCITCQKDPVYQATIVGKPPKEDVILGKVTSEIFFPIIKMMIPEIVDMELPEEGVFHNLCIVSIEKRYPGQAKKVINAIWGLFDLSLTKVVLVLDKDVNIRDGKEVLWRALNNIDPKRDIVFSEGPVDILDHASPRFGYGSKMGIDATKKFKDEGYERKWPDMIEMDEDVKKRVDEILERLGLRF